MTTARAGAATHDVFVSYAHADAARAGAICDALERDGLRCWMAPRDVPAGLAYAQALVDAITASRLVVAVFSRSANASEAVLNELEIAFNRGVPILPVRLADVEPSGAAEFYLRRRQWFDAGGAFELRLDALAPAVRTAIATAHPAPRPKKRARATDATVERRGLLVGRELELQRIAGALTAASRGHGSVIVLRGEPGIGKTRLLQATSDEALSAGFVPVSTVNFEYARTPLGPWIDILRAVESAVSGVAPSDPNDRAAYYRLLGITGDGAGRPATDRRRLFVIIAEALERASQRSPLLLAIDDVHWADPETIELLDFLVPRLDAARVVVLVACRSQRSDDASIAILKLQRYPNVAVIELGGLSDLAVRQLITVMAPSDGFLERAAIDALCRRSDGNPLFASELVRGAAAADASLLPASVQLSVIARLGALSAPDARILETAAVIGRVFTIEDLTAIANADRGAVVAALRAARDAGFVAETNDGTTFAFCHELFRAGIYEQSLAAERAAIHRAFAELLTTRAWTPAALLAHHWQRAGERERACAYAFRAGDEALSLNAPASARDAYSDALASGVLTGRDAAIVQEKAAGAADALGDAAAAAELFAQALAFYEGCGEADEVARLSLRFAANAYRAGRTDDFVRACERVLESRSSPKLLYGAHAGLASFFAVGGDAVEGRRHIAAADRLGVEGEVRDALSVEWARATVADAQSDGWLQAAERAVSLAERRGTPALYALNLMNFAMLSRSHGHDQALTEPVLRHAIELADAYGSTYTAAYARCELVRSLHFHGRLQDAYDVLLHAISLHVEALIVRMFVAQVGLNVLADLGVLDRFPALRDPGLLEAAFAAGEAGRSGPLAAAHVHAAVMGAGPAAAAPIIKRALGVMESFNEVGEALLTFARYGGDDDVAAVAALLPAVTPPGPATLQRLCIETIVAARTASPAVAERGAAALNAARTLQAPLFEALVLETLGRTREAADIYRRAGARGHLVRLSATGASHRPRRRRQSSAV